MKIYASVADCIGGTPLIELTNIERERKLSARVLVKFEALNPGGSIKDRVALSMIDSYEAEGKLVPGSVIIEPTSGNTGIGLCMIAAARGYRAVIVMPDSMSKERQKLMKAFGAELVLTDGKLGMSGAIAKAEEIRANTPGSVIAGQFVNPANPLAHIKSTGPEIFRDTDGEVDILVAGVGTGGTVTGIGGYLKEKKPSVRVVAVEPANSAVLSGGKAGPHGLQGIGAGFVPEVLDTGIIDETFAVTDEQAFETGRLLAKREGILAGITSGAAAYAALSIAEKPENAGKTIVAILPDTGDRYLSTAEFAD